jgi:transcriptional regulator GlxA family with amidase domain
VTTSPQADLALAGLLEGAGAADPDAPAAGCPVCGCQPPGRHRALPRLHGELLVAWLAANYQRPGVKVSEMAEAVGLSVRRLQAVCKRDFGRTPLQLLTDIRLYRAGQMLDRDPAAPRTLAEVARAAGFTRTHRFTTAYHRRYGTAPVITVPAAEDSGPQQHQEGPGTPWP